MPAAVMKLKLRFLHALPYRAESFSLLSGPEFSCSFSFGGLAHARAERISHCGDASAAR